MLKSVETLEDFNYVNKYVAYHKKNQPKKYNDMTYIVIKKYK